jgi:hypothetical protein
MREGGSVNLKRLFERKRPFIKAQLNGQGSYILIPIKEAEHLVEEGRTLEPEDRLHCSIVMMRPSDVAALPEHDGW